MGSLDELSSGKEGGYDEAPSCSSFAPGSFDIDGIFHVHCTKPVWYVTTPSLLNQQPDTPSDEVSHPIWTSIADTDTSTCRNYTAHTGSFQTTA